MQQTATAPYDDGQPPPLLLQQNTATNVPISASSLSGYQYPSNISNFTSQQQYHTSPTSADFLIPLPPAETDHARSTSQSVGEDSFFGSGSAPRATSSSSQQLTGQQAAYLQALYSCNVPAPAMAVVMERMFQEGGTTTGMPPRTANSPSFGSDVKRAPTTASHPPSYDS